MANAEVDRAGERRLLEGARWELMPFSSFHEQLSYVPPDAIVTITASPTKGIEPTIEFAIEAASTTEYDIVPHLAARAIKDRDQLDAFAGRLRDVGITDIFVPGGDYEEPVGDFRSAYELLIALEELGYDFEEIGITGYPEGHPVISDTTLTESLHKKAPLATYLATQICYSPQTIVEWIEAVRDDGVSHPVQIGIPGVMKYQKLIGISARVGVGDSIRFVRKTSGIVDSIRRMIGSRGVYRPDELVDGLAPYATDEYYDIDGLHLYTFNRAEDTRAWVDQRLG